MKLFLIAISVSCSATLGAPETLYDIDFSAPIHTVGEAAAIDLGPAVRRGVSLNSFNEPVVVDSHASLTDGALMFRSTDFRLSQIELAVEHAQRGLPVDAPADTLDVDLIIENLGGPADDFSIFFDTPTSSRVSLRGDGLISAPGVGFLDEKFSFGQLLRFSITADIDARRLTVNLDGNQIHSGDMTGTVDLLRAVRFSLEDRDAFDAVAYIDNVRLRAIPAPASVLLLAAASTPAMCRRRRSTAPAPAKAIQ